MNLGSSMAHVSFIVPCFNEKDNLLPLIGAFDAAFASYAGEWDLLLVDDGSSDGTYEEIKRLSGPHVRGIQFSRNFGKEAAVRAGLDLTKSAAFVGIIDADLQQRPEVARDMLEWLQAHPAYDCVAAVQEDRSEGFLRSWFSVQFYKVFQHASRGHTIANASDFRVFRRSVADALISMPETHRFSKGLFAWIGFETKPWPYVAEERYAGESKWSIRSLFAYAFEGIASFSTAPLRAITIFGLLVSIVAVIYAIILILKTLLLGIDVPGYASILTVILLLGGTQVLSIGVVGEYLARVYEQGKGRPHYIIRSSTEAEEVMQDECS